jgi:hypothetical protein
VLRGARSKERSSCRSRSTASGLRACRASSTSVAQGAPWSPSPRVFRSSFCGRCRRTRATAHCLPRPNRSGPSQPVGKSYRPRSQPPARLVSERQTDTLDDCSGGNRRSGAALGRVRRRRDSRGLRRPHLEDGLLSRTGAPAVQLGAASKEHSARSSSPAEGGSARSLPPVHTLAVRRFVRTTVPPGRLRPVAQWMVRRGEPRVRLRNAVGRLPGIDAFAPPPGEHPRPYVSRDRRRRARISVGTALGPRVRPSHVAPRSSGRA